MVINPMGSQSVKKITKQNKSKQVNGADGPAFGNIQITSAFLLLDMTQGVSVGAWAMGWKYLKPSHFPLFMWPFLPKKQLMST